MKKILIALSIMLVSLHHYALAQVNGATATTKATATLSSSCTISAQNVGFGQLSLPVTSQSASSNMNVQCSNAAPYTITLSYGGIYGQGTSTATLNNSTAYVIPSSGGQWYCGYSGSYNGSNYSTQFDNIGGCPSTTQYQISTGYSYGKMSGISNGDSVAYSIALPGNSSKVWNNGINDYTATGTGSSQSIPVVVSLVPAQTASKYPAPDMYSDTVTALIKY